jgi:hypothetical protein
VHYIDNEMKYVRLLVLSVWRLLLYYRFYLYLDVFKLYCAREVFEQVQIANLTYLLIFIYSFLISKVHILHCCNLSFLLSFLHFIPFKFSCLMTRMGVTTYYLVFRVELDR